MSDDKASVCNAQSESTHLWLKAHFVARPVEPDIVLVRHRRRFPANAVTVVETMVAVLGGRTVQAPGLVARVYIFVRKPVAGPWRREVTVAIDGV